MHYDPSDLTNPVELRRETIERQIRAAAIGAPGLVNHWGRWVDSEDPSPGVYSLHGLEWIHEEEGIDPDWEEFAESATEEEIEHADWTQDQSLIGFVLNERTGQYDPDPAAEFVAVVHYSFWHHVTILRSSWWTRAALCSPCCPGQADGDTPGDFLAFAPPPSVIGTDGDQELRARVFSLLPVRVEVLS